MRRPSSSVRHAEVDLGLRPVGDHVGAHAAAHDPHVDRHATRPVGEARQLDQPPGQLQDRVVAAVEVCSRVRGHAPRPENEGARALARGLDGAAGPGGLEVQDGRRRAHLRLHPLAVGRAAHLFVGREEHAHRRQPARAGGQQPQGVDGHHQSALHVVGPRSIEAAVLDARRPLAQGAQGPDGVEVPQQQDRAARRTAAREQQRAGARDGHRLHVQGQCGQLALDARGQRRHRRRVRRRRFDLYELAQERGHIGRLSLRRRQNFNHSPHSCNRDRGFGSSGPRARGALCTLRHRAGSSFVHCSAPPHALPRRARAGATAQSLAQARVFRASPHSARELLSAFESSL